MGLEVVIIPIIIRVRVSLILRDHIVGDDD